MEMATEKWKCRHPAYVAGFGVVAAGQIIEFAPGGAPPKVKALFERISDAEARKAKEDAEAKEDMTFRAKVERLKDMKIPIPKGANKAQIDELFDRHVSTVAM